MPGKVTRSIRLKSGDIVQITVPVNATANQLREAIAQAASKVSTNLMGDLADIGYEGALEPQRANDTGFEKAKTPARFDQPVDRGFADPSRDYPSPSGSISATPDTLQSRAVGLGTSALSALGLGEKDAYRQASRYIDPAFEWTAAGSPDIAAEGVRDLVGGRYLDAAGNLGMAALDLVPGVGKGASALAMFLGPMAKNANIQMLEKAKLMADAGVDRDEIWKETGWFNQHGDWKFEISDLGLNVKKGILPKRGMGIKATAVLEHPELEANYPELKGGIFGNPLRVGGHVGGPKIAGAYYPDQHVVTFNTGRTKPQMVSTAAHELQHGLPQVTENFPIGSRVGEHPPVWAGPEVEALEASKKSFTGLLETMPDEVWLDPAVIKQLRYYDDEIDREAAREAYRRSAGEVEARNVQSRLAMEQGYKKLGWSPETIAKQMRDTPPWLTQDRADELQIVRRAEPIINDPRKAGPQLSEDLTAPLEIDQTLPAQMDITAYHGSPHDFDRFDSSKIGMGEGVQAYGHGLYFSENPDVARSYRDALKTGGTIDLGTGPLANQQAADAIFARLTEAHGADVKVHNVAGAAADMLARHGDNAAANLEHAFRGDDEYQPIVKAAADILRAAKPSTGGSLYETNIKAEPEDFIDWDTPLAEQPLAKKAVRSFYSDYSGSELREELRDMKTLTAGEWMKKHPGTNNQLFAQHLRDAGFPGIRYLDQGSRGAGEGTRNYVVFDDSRLDILKRNDQPIDLTGGAMQASEDLPKSALSGFEPSKAAMKTAKQLSTMAGSPAGPGKKATTRQVKKLSEDYLRQVDQGKEGADWYEQSGRSIMEHMGEDEAKAIKLAGAIGVTSARTPVLPNLEHGVRGHMQMMGGQPVVTGGFPTRMGGNIRDIYGQPDMTLDQLRGLGDEAFGPKVTPFIQQNLMYEGFEPGQPSTARAVHDIWDMRARGYTDKSGQPFTGTASTPQHRWTDLQDQGYLLPEANARQIGDRTDWDTGRAQAAAWVGNKIDALMREGKTFAEAQKIAVTDYSHGWDRLYAQHSWESAPGSNTGHMGGFDDLPWEEKQRYHEDVKGAFLNPEGQSRIALGYGAPTGKSYDTTGLYEGVVNPGTQDLIAVAREPGKQTIDPGSRSVLDAVASTQGLLGAQKGAAWNYQSPTKSSIKGADAFRFDLGRTLSLEDIERLGPQIQQAYPSGNVGLLPDPSGLKLVKFWDEDSDLPMGDFVKGLQKSEGLPKPFPTTQSGNYMENAWDAPEGRFGGQYVSTLKGLDIPDIGAKFDSFAPQIAQELVNNIDPKIMQAAGLTGSADMDRLRRTIAGEGWAGLNKLIDSQKGSVEAKAALLAAFAGLAGLGGMAATSEAQPQ